MISHMGTPKPARVSLICARIQQPFLKRVPATILSSEAL